MKTTLKTRPMYHWKAERIRGHILISYIALYIQRLIELKVKEAGYSYSTMDISINAFGKTITKDGYYITKGRSECYETIEDIVYNLQAK